MEFDGETFTFKSFPEFYEKEATDIKNNTIRVFHLDQIDEFRYDWDTGKQFKIKMVNTKTKESFARRIRDICFIHTSIGEVTVIFTWEEENK
jgi:hypothetical protein